MKTTTPTQSRQAESRPGTSTVADGDPKSVRFAGVAKSFGPTEVLSDFSIDIAPGSMVSFLGPSGCGKTTTLRILAGFESVDAGEVLVGGESVLGLPPNRRDMGMVFQSYSLFPNLTVAENIDYGLRIRKVDAGARTARRGELLEVCGLSGLGERFPHQLSGGQQQRVALARALATRPRVLLLDEPLSALDATVRSALRDEIRRVQQSLGTTTIFITHDQGEALAIADRVAVMNSGRIEQYAQPEDVYAQPATSFVARFVGSINEFAVPNDWRAGDRLPDEPDGADIVFIRPENLAITPATEGSLQVMAKTYTGERTMIRLGRPGHEQSHDDGVGAEAGQWSASLSSADAATLSPGDRVSARVTSEPALRRPRTEAGGRWV